MRSVQGSRQGTWQFVRLVSFDAPLPNDLTSLDNTQSLPEDHVVGIYAGEKKHQQDLHLQENRTLCLSHANTIFQSIFAGFFIGLRRIC